MRFIKSPKAELLVQPDYTWDGMLMHIERCARICYKSDREVTPESAHRFVQALVNRGHLSPLEHGNIFIKVPHIRTSVPISDLELLSYIRDNKYVKTSTTPDDMDIMTVNMRVIQEFGNDTNIDKWRDMLEKYMVSPNDKDSSLFNWRITLKLIGIDIGVTREGNRHRVFSILEQSTRYCNYSKAKFGNELTYILPQWMQDVELDENGHIKDPICSMSVAYQKFFDQLRSAEKAYMDLLEEGWKPQQTRQILPIDTATEVIYTGYEDAWSHFLDLRLQQSTGAVHPNMLAAAKTILPVLNKFPYGDVLFF